MSSHSSIQTLLYAVQLAAMSDQELFDECMDELYPEVKHDKKGCLIHELMERLEANIEEQ